MNACFRKVDVLYFVKTLVVGSTSMLAGGEVLYCRYCPC